VPVPAAVHDSGVQRAKGRDSELTAFVAAEGAAKLLMRQVQNALSTLVAGEMDSLFALVTREVPRAIRCARATLFLVEEPGKGARANLRTVFAEGTRVSLPITRRSIAGGAVAENKPQLVHDAYLDARFDPHWDRKTGFRTHAVLCYPIRAALDHDVRYGCVQLINKQDAGGGAEGVIFQESDIRLVDGLCKKLASVLLRASASGGVFGVTGSGRVVHRVEPPLVLPDD